MPSFSSFFRSGGAAGIRASALKVVQRQLRHADARTTLEIYGHLVGDAQRQAVEQVASVLDAIGRPSGALN